MEVSLINIETNEEADYSKFPGSPTIRVNEKALFPTNQSDYALGCRVYQTPQEFKGSPTKEMLTRRFREFLDSVVRKEHS